MVKQMKNVSGNKGITLIALVISIIVMLILAGVSINAIIGDNGILSRAQYSTFLNEMAAVEEAVELWKAGEFIDSKGEMTTAIPANGLCKVNDLTATERLVGEIGYYRVWSIGETMPVTNILSSASNFNSAFESEFIFYPAGVQDLYYLNNEALGLKDDKVYLIDASTSMVYSMTGISLNGVRCYSIHMAKAVMGGTNTAPLFAEAEVSGTGSGEILAGNVQEEYLEDGALNPDYNPNGFQIISYEYSDNVYKLYNNGNLYAKGLKSLGADSSFEELEKISMNEWMTPKLFNNLSNYKKVKYEQSTLFFIDMNDDLWAVGENSNNKLGLTNEQSKEFTARELIKLSVKDDSGNDLKIADVYSSLSSTFVLTVDGKLYACGGNKNGSLGVGLDSSAVLNFQECKGLPEQFRIKKISGAQDWNEGASSTTMIFLEDGSVYEAGYNIFNEKNNKFVKILSNDNFESNIIDVEINNGADGISRKIFVTLSNGNFLYRNMGTNINWVLEEEINNIVEIRVARDSIVPILKDKNNKYYFYNYNKTESLINNFGIDLEKAKNEIGYYTFLLADDVLPENLFSNNDEIKYIIPCYSTSTSMNCIYIMNSGKVYGIGNKNYLGLGNAFVNSISSNSVSMTLLNIDGKKIVEYQNDKISTSEMGNINPIILFDENNNIYTTGMLDIMYGDDILQQSWKHIASNVKKISVGGTNTLAIIDKTDNAYVILKDYADIGVESVSEDVELGNNFRKITDENLINNIDNISFSNGAVFILTKDKKLYSAGKGLYDTTWVANAYSGHGTEANTRQELLAEKVRLIDSICGESILSGNVYVTDEKIYFFGNSSYKGLGSTIRHYTPIEIDISTLSNFDVNEISKISISWASIFIIMNNGDLYASGQIGALGLETGLNEMSLQKYESSINFENEKIIDVQYANAYYNIIILTDAGNVYGWGVENLLGKGLNSSSRLTISKLDIDNVMSITGNRQGFIAIKKDGTVWGTGFNKYGVLGRWIGVDRGESNSRYKTALNWVECPELEI